MKKKLLGILAVSAALMITACNKPAENKSGGEPSSQQIEPTPAREDVRVTGVSLDRNNVSLKPGAYTRLIATVAPQNASNKRVFWKSSNPAIASVDEKGTVTANSKGQATITVQAFDGEFSDTCTVTVEAPHAIRVKGNNNDVRVLIDEQAEADDLVEFRVSYDNTRYVLEGVYANGIKCGTKGANFYFFMPDTPVTMEARYHAAPAEAVYKEVRSASEGVYISGLEGGVALVGSSATFTISLEPGLDFDGNISAKDDNGNNVPLTKVGSGTYSIDMPNANVNVTVGTKKQLIPFHIYGDSFNTCVDDFKVNGERYDKTYIEYGAEVEITLRQPTNGLYDKYTIDSVALFGPTALEMASQYDYEPCEFIYYNDYIEASEEDSYKYTFNMPGHETWIQLKEEPRYVEFELYAADGIDFLPLVIEDGSLVLTEDYEYKTVYGEALYLYPFFDEGMGVRTIYLEPYEYYTNYFGGAVSENLTSRTKCNLVTVGSYKLYQVPVNYRPTGNLVLTIDEKYEDELEGSPLVGDYLGYSFTAVNRESTQAYTARTSASYRASIGVDGDIAIGTSAASYGYLGYDKMSTVGYMYAFDDPTFNPYYFVYDNGVLYSERSRNLLATPNNKFIAFQKADAEDADTLYNMYYANFDAGNVVVAQMYRDSALYQTVYLNYKTGEFYTGVTVEMLAGASITASNAKYNVYYGDLLVARVSYKSSGGASNRAIIPEGALVGSFIDDRGVYGALVADGLGGLTFGGNPAEVVSYDPETGIFVFIDNSDDTTYTVKVAELLGLYTFISKQESLAINFIGNTYTLNSYCWRDREATMQWEATRYSIEFIDASHAKVAFTIGSTTYANTTNATYVIRDNQIQITFKPNSSSTTYVWKFTFNASYSAITLTDDSPTASLVTNQFDYWVRPDSALGLQ